MMVSRECSTKYVKITPPNTSRDSFLMTVSRKQASMVNQWLAITPQIHHVIFFDDCFTKTQILWTTAWFKQEIYLCWLGWPRSHDSFLMTVSQKHKLYERSACSQINFSVGWTGWPRSRDSFLMNVLRKHIHGHSVLISRKTDIEIGFLVETLSESFGKITWRYEQGPLWAKLCYLLSQLGTLFSCEVVEIYSLTEDIA